MPQHPSLTYVVRQRVTVARHLDRYWGWLWKEQIPALRAAIPQIVAVRHYKEEKDELVRMTFYDFAEGTPWIPATRLLTKTIRAAWTGFADSRDLSAQPFARIWSAGPGTTTSGPHPIIVGRMTVVPEKREEFDPWHERIWEAEQRTFGIASVHRYWALDEPRFYLEIQEFEDDAAMRRKIADSEPAKHPAYWEAWREWMPYVENMGRFVFLPVTG